MKHKNRAIVVILLITCFLITSLSSGKAFAGEPKLWANSAILMDLKTGQVLYEKDGTDERHPASLTKIMTAILALENGNLSDVITISRKTARISVGQTIKLREGEMLTLEDLIYAALLHSANDAAMAIAEHIGGSEEIFLKMMNHKALALGATKTRFENPNGYTKPNHRTTAYDLALITRYAMANDTFAKIVRTKSRTIYKLGVGPIGITNTNQLLTLYPGVIGAKTGTTAAAGGCLAAVAENSDQTLIAIILKSGDKRRYQDCINLLEYGFKEIKDYKISEKGDLWEELFIPGAKPNTLKIVCGESLSLRLTEEQYAKLEKRLILDRKPKLPVSKGQKLGQLNLYLDNEKIANVNLLAGGSLSERTFWNSLLP